MKTQEWMTRCFVCGEMHGVQVHSSMLRWYFHVIFKLDGYPCPECLADLRSGKVSMAEVVTQ